MEGKLKKIGNEYKLYAQDDSCIATTHESPYKKLSLKNCEAISNGYDLDELAHSGLKKETAGFFFYQSTGFIKGFHEGFQKALEILGDKKFNRQDVVHALTYGVREAKNGRNHSQILEEYRDVNLTQQTEWDVTFNPDEKDSDNCLILKRL